MANKYIYLYANQMKNPAWLKELSTSSHLLTKHNQKIVAIRVFSSETQIILFDPLQWCGEEILFHWFSLSQCVFNTSFKVEEMQQKGLAQSCFPVSQRTFPLMDKVLSWILGGGYSNAWERRSILIRNCQVVAPSHSVLNENENHSFPVLWQT